MRINGHGHILPEPFQIPQFMKDKKLFWIDDDKKFMRQGNWSRPITDPSFFLEDKMIWMQKHNIDHAVMLNLSQLYCNGWDKQDTIDGIRFQNDFNGKLQEDHPTKFTCGFVVQPLHMDHALAEIERCVGLGMSLLCLPTHYLNAEGKWLSIADQSVDPIYEAANKYNLAVQIHPYDGEKMIALEDQHWRFHLVWMMAQCADTLHLYTLRNLPNKYPNMRTSFAHGCMLGMANYGRRVQGFDVRPDKFKGTEDPRTTLGHKNLFFDTLVHDVDTLELLKKRVGVDQIMVGLDDPYPLGEMDGVGNSYPGKVIDEALKNGVFSEADKHAVWSTNVLKWLGK